MSGLLPHLLRFVPHRLRVLLARRMLGWEIHPTAHLGRSVLRVGHLRMAAGSSIGNGNRVWGLDELVLGEGASIGGDNVVTGSRSGTGLYGPTQDEGRRPRLVLGAWATITVAHHIDCADLVELEHHATILGFGSVVLTHSLDLRTDRFRTQPVRLGHHSCLMSGCTVFMGVTLAPQLVVSAGSVVSRSLDQPFTLYRGNPAEPIRTLDEDGVFLNRARHFGKGTPGEPAD